MFIESIPGTIYKLDNIVSNDCKILIIPNVLQYFTMCWDRDLIMSDSSVL